MSATEETIALLTSIDSTLKAMLSLAQKRTARVEASQPKPIAPDRDLDGQHGDPLIKMKDPRDWTGEPMKGRRFSQCPPEYLDLLADRFDYFAQKAEETNEQYNNKPVAPMKRKDAARARGWAKRMRDGKHDWQAASGHTGDQATTDDWTPDDATPAGW